jgi:hypothetical protein
LVLYVSNRQVSRFEVVFILEHKAWRVFRNSAWCPDIDDSVPWNIGLMLWSWLNTTFSRWQIGWRSVVAWSSPRMMVFSMLVWKFSHCD